MKRFSTAVVRYLCADCYSKSWIRWRRRLCRAMTKEPDKRGIEDPNILATYQPTVTMNLTDNADSTPYAASMLLAKKGFKPRLSRG